MLVAVMEKGSTISVTQSASSRYGGHSHWEPEKRGRGVSNQRGMGISHTVEDAESDGDVSIDQDLCHLRLMPYQSSPMMSAAQRQLLDNKERLPAN